MASLPDGYTIRAPRLEEAESVVDMCNEESTALIGIPLVSVDWLLGMWQAPSFDLERDAAVVIAPDGAIAGSGWVQTRPPYTRVTSIGVTAFGHHGRGVGRALVEESERRAGRFVDLAPADAAVLIYQGTLANEPMIAGLLSGLGYREARLLLQMNISFDHDPPVPELPDGFELRPVVAGEEAAVHACLHEAFKDHWGDTIPLLEDWRHEYVDTPRYAPHLWTLAWHGPDLAGAVVGVDTAEENPDYGYIAELAVRREFRRRGLGDALLRTSFAQFREAGKAGVLLFVDAESLTGATRLYERAGMTSEPRFATWEKELRPGTRPEADG